MKFFFLFVFFTFNLLSQDLQLKIDLRKERFEILKNISELSPTIISLRKLDLLTYYYATSDVNLEDEKIERYKLIYQAIDYFINYFPDSRNSYFIIFNTLDPLFTKENYKDEAENFLKSLES